MGGRSIVVDILGDATKFSKATKDATTSAGQFSNVLKGVGQGIGIGFTNLVADAGRAVVDWGVKSVDAFREEEVGINRLGASLQANVTNWDGNTEAIEKQISAMVRTTAFSDGEMRDSLSRLVAVTHDVNEAFDLQRTAMDLARFKGISLVDASQALIKVEGGQYRALKELGIVLKSGATQTEALAAVQKVAGGQMAAYMETTAAKTEVLDHRLEDLQEEFGARVSPALANATEKLIGFMDAMDPDTPLTFTDRILNMADALTFLAPHQQVFIDEARRSTEETEAQDAAVAAAGDSWDTFAEKNAAAREPVKALTDALRVNRTVVKGLGQRVAYLVGGYKDIVDWSAKAAEALDPKKPEKLRLEFERSRLELRENQNAMEDLGDEIQKRMDNGKKPTLDQKQRMVDLKLAILDNEQSVEELGLQMVQTGEITYADLMKWFDKLDIKIDKAEGSASSLLGKLYAIQGLTDLGTSYDNKKKGIGGKAAGGSASGLTWVGEQGPELLDLPSGSFVHSNSRSRQMTAGAPVVIQLQVDGRELARIVDRNLYYEAARAPQSARAG